MPFLHHTPIRQKRNDLALALDAGRESGDYLGVFLRSPLGTAFWLRSEIPHEARRSLEERTILLRAERMPPLYSLSAGEYVAWLWDAYPDFAYLLSSHGMKRADAQSAMKWVEEERSGEVFLVSMTHGAELARLEALILGDSKKSVFITTDSVALGEKLLRLFVDRQRAQKNVALLTSESFSMVPGKELSADILREYIRHVFDVAVGSGARIVVVEHFSALDFATGALGLDLLKIIEEYLHCGLRMVAVVTPARAHALLGRGVIKKNAELFHLRMPTHGDLIATLKRLVARAEQVHGIIFTYPALVRLVDNVLSTKGSGDAHEQVATNLARVIALASKRRQHRITATDVSSPTCYLKPTA